MRRIDLQVGNALDMLPGLVDGGHSFDLAFIDSDKENNAAHAAWAAAHVRPGGLVIVDNVVGDGRITDDHGTDPQILGTRSLHAAMRMDSRFEAKDVQLVGTKGRGGLMIARRR